MTSKRDGGFGGGIGLSFGIKTGEEKSGDEGEKVERPVFRIAVVAEATARREFSTGRAPGDKSLPLTRLAFDDVMRELGPALVVEVDNLFDPGEKPLRVDLRFDSFKAFKPESIVDQVPALRALVDAHRVLERVQDNPASARDELARILPQGRFTDSLLRDLAATGSPRPAAGGSAGQGAGIDALLDKVGFSEPSESSGLDSVVAAVARSGRTGSGSAPATDGAARIESAFARLLGALLDHPEVARLESIWRSLYLLAGEAGQEKAVEIDLVAVPADGIAGGLVRIAEAAHRGPPDLIVVAAEVEPTARALEELQRWAELAEGLRAPLVADGGAGLLGYDTLDEVARSSVRISASTDPRAVLFKSFAAKDASRWVAITLNRPLARGPHTTESARLRDMPLPEGGVGGYRYLGGAFVLGVLAARSFVRFGIASALTGAEHGKLGNLPVHDWDDRGRVYAIPLESFIPTETQSEIARAGVVAFSSARNHDAAILTAAPVVYRGESVAKGGDAPAVVGLGDQLFVGRFSYAVEQLASAMPASADPRVLADTARVVLHGFFSIPPPAGPEIEARADGAVLEVTVRPRRYAGISLQEITLRAPLAGA